MALDFSWNAEITVFVVDDYFGFCSPFIFSIEGTICQHDADQGAEKAERIDSYFSGCQELLTFSRESICA